MFTLGQGSPNRLEEEVALPGRSWRGQAANKADPGSGGGSTGSTTWVRREEAAWSTANYAPT